MPTPNRPETHPEPVSSPTPPPLLVGCAAGFSGDRTDAARPVVDTLLARGGPACLVFETLAERTLALAQLARQADPQGGFEPLLDELLRPVLADCVAHGVRIVGNFGAAHPVGAARRVLALAAELGVRAPRVAVLLGDDLSAPQHHGLLREALAREGGPAPDGMADDPPIASANVYLGAEGIAQALRAGAEVVVTGRVADPSLVVGPALAHFGWRADDWDRIARATMAGHLLECGAQVSGGYYADPGFKDVPGLAQVGFPIAEIDADGGCVVGKAEGTGGCVDEHTVKEQLLYELHDPAAYLTPDVVADISAATVRQVGADRVRLEGVRGHPRPATLKALVFHRSGWLCEAGISYAGPGAEARARLAAQVLRERWGSRGALRLDLLGVASLYNDDAGRWLDALPPGDVRDVRLHAATRQPTRAAAEQLAREVTALYTCGPAGGGGVRSALRERLGSRACFVPREAVPMRVEFIS